MNVRNTTVLLATLLLAACSAPKTENAGPEATSPAASTPAAAPAADTAAATGAPPVSSSSAADMPGMTAEQHAAMGAAAAKQEGADNSSESAAASSVQAGWYTAGMFRACGSTAALKVDKTNDIDAQIRSGGMSAADPVYVQLEGMPMGSSDFMVTRVVQVGSKTPVRDCPMTGTTIQSGG